MTKAFTPAEKQVLTLLCTGYARKEIAEKLAISVSTVDFHLRNMRGKAYARNSLQLAVVSYRSL